MDIEEYKKQWIDHFRGDVPARRIQKYVVATGNLIWHLFSWELVPSRDYLQGDRARKAFDSLCAYQKEQSLVIEPFADRDAYTLPAHLLIAKKLDKYIEIYVTANDYSWTYIKTHEGDLCGPYFYQPKTEKTK